MKPRETGMGRNGLRIEPAPAGSLAGLRTSGAATTLVLYPGAAALAVLAWNGGQGLASLALLTLVPALICRAASRATAFLVAFAYYGAAARAVPGILHGFFPGLSRAACLSLWALHGAVLALPWMLAWAGPDTPAWRRGAGAALALLVLSLPPLGLFHWASPLLAAGLLFPGWRWAGLLLALGWMALLAAGSPRRQAVRAVLLGGVLLALGANAVYRAPPAPAGWVAVSLALGKSPELWSEEMGARRALLAGRALRELRQGARVVIFPESISGSNRRAQADLWRPVALAAARRGATVLVGEESWDRGRTGFRNALVAYGSAGEETVVASSRVPMPLGDWKFGIEEGAATDVFGDDVVALQGRRVAFSLCYEDFLLWTHRGLLAGRADLLVSATNQWPSSGTSAETGQDLSRAALARLAGVPLLTAKNH
jgi:apolipoprotein N-acyltransferase